MAVGDFNFHVFPLHSGKIDARDETVVLLDHVELGGPVDSMSPSERGCWPAERPPEPLIEHPVEFGCHRSQQRERIVPAGCQAGFLAACHESTSWLRH